MVVHALQSVRWSSTFARLSLCAHVKPPPFGAKFWQLLATAGQDGSVRLWQPMTGSPLALFFEGERWVNSVAFSADGYWLAAGLELGAAAIWELGSGHLVWRLHGHQDSVRCVAFSPDGRLLATGGRDSTARLWSVETGRPLAVAGGQRAAVSVVVFWPRPLEAPERAALHLRAPASWLLATGSQDGSARLWSVVCDP